jgi:hypothetical protein
MNAKEAAPDFSGAASFVTVSAVALVRDPSLPERHLIT